LALTLTAFNCIGCHTRDGFGGVAEDRNPYFRSTEMNLGDDGRIPPPLTLLGAKLKPVWLNKVLFDGESVRPYMLTRMPQYGHRNLGHLPDLVSRLDIMEGVELRTPSPESRSESEVALEKRLRPAGKELLGDQGLNCIACHNFNGKPSPLNKGMDLMTTHQRLQSAWFNNFLRKPGAYRPRIIMPYSWPDGIAVHKTILDGDAQQQIEAIWYYLSLGTSAADPSGIRRPETKLVVNDKVMTYRGRSKIAGFRGIAVGFPEHLNYAFNAETGTLTGLWHGEFIRVDRGGQGSGNFNPASPAISLAQDVSFAELAAPDTAWPLQPTMSKEAPANPNPLYPKNLGYRFKGYYLDHSSNPTFMYDSGSIAIEDRSIVDIASPGTRLKRMIEFSAASPRTIWFRALSGDVVQETENVYTLKKLRMTVPANTATLRSAAASADSAELLLRLNIPQGKSSIELIYELF
jgi:mono/diheme cytochrome c family protein